LFEEFLLGGSVALALLEGVAFGLLYLGNIFLRDSFGRFLFLLMQRAGCDESGSEGGLTVFGDASGFKGCFGCCDNSSGFCAF
jgi:hypothetical protein